MCDLTCDVYTTILRPQFRLPIGYCAERSIL